MTGVSLGGNRFHGQLFLGQFLVFSVALWMLQGKEELLDSRAHLCEGELQSYWTKKVLEMDSWTISPRVS